MRQRTRFLIVAGLLAFSVGGGIWWSIGVHEVAPTASAPVANLPDRIPHVTDWPNWRGAAGTGVAAEAHPPREWSDSTHRVWSVPVPGRGHASPCIWGEQVFLATADEGAAAQLLVSFDRSTGARRWQTEIHRGGLMDKHLKNTHASATPACDGTHLYTPYLADGALWVTAVDLAGHAVWRTEAGPFTSKWGYGSAPVLFQSLVIVVGDNRGARLDRLVGSSFLTALNRATGQVAWRIKRPAGDSYGTPIVAEVAGRQQLLLSGKKQVTSYNPATGEEIWTCRWGADRTAGTMSWEGDFVFASATQPSDELICIRADGKGDVTDTHLVWRAKKGATDVPSPLVYQHALYVVGDHGVITCFATDTGKVLWKKRLGGDFSASPVAADGLIYCTSEAGVTYVLKAGPEFEQVAENTLNESVFATPALCGEQIFLRTEKNLYCFGGRSTSLAEKPASGARN
jgi:hypothetical protein